MKRENPTGILDNRFAKGEISKEEYEEQKRTLNTKN
ncbi:SHOCT domain-containing protein [Gelidibacter salicanalis]|nr:SHOCT domain-containing protein [Gelidibacter salicanalis]